VVSRCSVRGCREVGRAGEGVWAVVVDGGRRVTGPGTRGWRTAVTGGVLVWAAVKAAMAVLAVLVPAVRGGPSVTDPAGLATPDTADGFFGVLHHWDSSFFQGIATDGYFGGGADSSAQSFFPGYPVAARGVAEIITFGGPTDAALPAAMWLVGTIGSLTAAVLLWRLVEQQYPPGVARWATVLLLTGPYAVFLFADYSESMFLAFALAAWYCAARDRWVLVGVLSAAATFTRINGVFLVAALLVMYVQRRRRAGAPVIAPTLLWLPLACSGIAAYFAYLTIRTGDLLAWSHAQTLGWGRTLHWPWEAFYQTTGRVLFASTPDRRFQFAIDLLFAAVIMTAVIVLTRRKQWPEVTYLGLTLIALTTSSTYVSLARNSLTLFPLTILIAVTITHPPHRAMKPVILTAWWTLFAVNTTLFAFGYWTD